jgi:hypothetical protein
VATLTEIREGVADRLRTIPGLQASARMLTNPHLPVAYVIPGDLDFHQTMGDDGHTDWHIIVELQVGTVSDIGAQDNLDALISESGEQSVKAAIEAEPTLGGKVDDLIVQGVRDYGLFARAQGDAVLGARVLVWVLAAGD